MKQWWLWALLGLGTLVPVFGIYKQMIVGEPFGNKPASDTVLILLLLFMLCMMCVFWMMHLKTEVTVEYISAHFFPFTKRTFIWEDIKSATIVDYGFVGFGIRLGTKYGTVYNTGGNKGLAIQLTNGKKYCIGTQCEDELQKVVKQLIK